MKDKEQNTRRGRPQGAKNRKYADTFQIPARCPKCGGTELRVLVGAPVIERNIVGTLPGGYTFNKVIWRRKRCKECNQLLMIREYLTENNKDHIISVDQEPESD